MHVHADVDSTPVQNDLRELWAIFRWLYPDIFDKSTVGPFEEAFSLSDGKFDSEFLKNCKRFLELTMLRRTKELPGIGLDIPPKTEVNLSVPLSDLQHSWYLKILTGVDPLLTMTGTRRLCGRLKQESTELVRPSQ